MADIAELGIKVTTDGAKEASTQLKDVATSAEAAERAAASLGREQQKAARQADESSKASEKWAQSAWQITKSAETAGLAVGVALGDALGKVAGKLLSLVNDIITNGDRLKTLADQTNLSADALQRWEYIGRQVGVSSQNISMAMYNLNRSIGDAADGSGRGAEALRKLKITQDDLNKVQGDSDGKFKLVIERLRGISDDSIRANTATMIFRQGARELAPMLKLNSDEVEKLSEQYDRLGVGMSGPLVEASDKFSDSMFALGRAMLGTLFPAIEAVLVPLASFLEYIVQASSDSQIFIGIGKELGLVFDLLMVPLKGAAVLWVTFSVVVQQAGTAIGAFMAMVKLLGEAREGGWGRAKQVMDQAIIDIEAIAERGFQAQQKILGLDQADAQKKGAAGVDVVAAAFERLDTHIKRTSNNTSDYAETLKALSIVQANWTGTQAEYERLVKSIIATQPGATAALKEFTKAQRESAKEAVENRRLDTMYAKRVADSIKMADAELKAIQKVTDSRAKEFDQLNQNYKATTQDIAQTQLEIDKLKGLTGKYQDHETQLLKVDLAQLKVRRSAVAVFDNSAELVAALDKQIITTEILIDKRNELAATKIESETAKEAAQDWKAAAEQIEQSLTDAMVNGFDEGKSFAKSTGEWIVNYFKTTVARGLAQAIMTAVAAGFSSMASASGGSGSGVGSLLSLGSSLFSGGGAAGGSGSMLGMLGGAGSLMGAWGGTGFLGGVSATMTGTASLGGLSGLTSMAGSGSLSAGASALGVVAPYLLAAYGLYRVISGVGTGRMRGPAWQQWGTAGTMNNAYPSSILQNPALGGAGYYNQLIGGIQGAVGATAGMFGGRANANTGYGLYSSVGTEGSGALGSGQVLSSTGRSLFYYNQNSGSEADMRTLMGQNLPGMILAGLKDSDLPVKIKEFFNQWGENAAPSQEDLNRIIETAAAAHQMAESFKQLGGPFKDIQNLSVDARSALAGLTGGLEAFIQKVGGYYSNFYSQEEQQALSLLEARRTLEGAGIDTTGLIDKGSYRSAVEGLDLNNPEDVKKFAAYMNAAGAFASGADLLAATGMSLSQLTAGAPDYSQGITQQIEASATQTTALLGAISEAARVIVEAMASQKVEVSVNVPAAVEVSNWSGTVGGGN